MKLYFSVFIMLMSFSLTSRAEMDAFQVGNEELNCQALNGVTIASSKTKPRTVQAKLGLLSEEYGVDINPAFFTWTWVSLGTPGEVTAQGYQIFLVGNAPAGEKVTLHGWMGRMVSAPGLGGMLYPLGFIPESLVSCQVYWENMLDRQ